MDSQSEITATFSKPLTQAERQQIEETLKGTTDKRGFISYEDLRKSLPLINCRNLPEKLDQSYSRTGSQIKTNDVLLLLNDTSHKLRRLSLRDVYKIRKQIRKPLCTRTHVSHTFCFSLSCCQVGWPGSLRAFHVFSNVASKTT